MIVRSRGGWLRRAIASGATIVALGAVLVGPQTASAAPLADPPVIAVTPCGDGTWESQIHGTVPEHLSDDTFSVRVFRPGAGTPHQSFPVTVGAANRYSLWEMLEFREATAVRVELWLTRPPPPVIELRAAAAAVAEPGLQGHAWHFHGCADIQTPRRVAGTGGALTVKVSLEDFLPGTVNLSHPGGGSVTPTEVTIPSSGKLADVPVTFADPPACSDSGAPVEFDLNADQASPGAGVPGRSDTSTLELYCPTLKTNPTSADDDDLPQIVTVSGTKWVTDYTSFVALFFDDQPLDGADSLVVNDDGSFGGPVTIPAVDCIDHKITAVQWYEPGPSFAPSAVAMAAGPDDIRYQLLRKEIPFNVECPAGQLDVDPAVMVERPGPQALDVTLRSFRRGLPVTLSMPGVTITPSTVTPTSGAEQVAITLDQQPACGRSTLTATQPQRDTSLPRKTATADVFVLCPRVTATPDTVNEVMLPEAVTLGGRGWIPRLQAAVLWDGKEIGTVTPELIRDPDDPTGSLTGQVTLPRTECGSHKLEVVQVLDTDDDSKMRAVPRALARLELRAATEITITCSTPQLIVQPQVMAPKAGTQLLDVKLSGFLQGVAVGLAVPGTVATPGAITPSRTDPGAATVTLDKQPACGRTAMTASQVDGGEFPVNRTATADLHLFCPKLATTPTVLDTKLPGIVGTTGTGWVPNQPVQLVVDGRLVTTLTVTDTGTIAGTPKLPRSACGRHKIEAVQVTGVDADPESTHLPELFEAFELRASTTLTVLCPPASLAVNPGVVVDGNSVEAAGVGFTPGRKVILEWTYDDGTRIGAACEVTASAGGTFLVNCLVLPNTALGSRLLTAVEIVPAGDPVIARTAKAPLLVVPGSMDRGRTDNRMLQRR